MDAYDLFKRLGSGAKFDFKRFRSDAERLKVNVCNHFRSTCAAFFAMSLVFVTHVFFISTSTLILPRAEASRASDVINMVKTSLFTVKNMMRMCCLGCVGL